MIPPTAPHGILAHYFHDDSGRFPRAQGSLSADDFRRGLDAYGTRLIRADTWITRALDETIEDAVCVTFDDGLLEQAVIALPVLEERGLTAAWYPYTAPLVGVEVALERDRWVRNHGYGSIKAFYAAWRCLSGATRLVSYRPTYGYLTEDDRAYRYWRDITSSLPGRRQILWKLRDDAPHRDPRGLQDIWTASTMWTHLFVEGHVIGFHTHSHPIDLVGLSEEEQTLEYATSRWVLAHVLGTVPEAITTMSHPCGSVTPYGLRWLRAQGVHLAWGATMDTFTSWMTAPRWSTGYWR